MKYEAVRKFSRDNLYKVNTLFNRKWKSFNTALHTKLKPFFERPQIKQAPVPRSSIELLRLAVLV